MAVDNLFRLVRVSFGLGYEDLNDHDQLRIDPLLAVMRKIKDVRGGRKQRDKRGDRAGRQSHSEPMAGGEDCGTG